MLKQDRNSPIAVELQIAIIYAVVNNLLSDVALEDVKSFEADLMEYLVATKEELLASIRNSGSLSDEGAAELRAAIEHCKAKYIK